MEQVVEGAEPLMQGARVGKNRPLYGRAAVQTLRFARRKPLGALGAAIILALAVLAIGADVIATQDPNSTSALTRFADPSRDHYLGTDNLGRDIFSRVVHGSRVA